jgi:hypothetical protein
MAGCPGRSGKSDHKFLQLKVDNYNIFLNGRVGVWKDPEDSYHTGVRYKVKQGLF